MSGGPRILSSLLESIQISLKLTLGYLAVLDAFLRILCDPSSQQWDMVHHERIPGNPQDLAPIPHDMDPVVKRLIDSTVGALYSHQAEAIGHCLKGENVVLSTSTASGKSLAFQAAVVDRLVRDPDASALFLFPLKALERDQRDSFLALTADLGLTAAVYDGDTPDAERRKIRANPPRVLITNPDMMHLSLMAYHDNWKEFFSHLSFVVLDEVHTYKGIFGAHVSQVLMRARRICTMYGSRPQFFACSATIANPGEFVSRLIGEETAVVDKSGAPTAERHFLFLNPILSPYTVATRLFVKGLKAGLKTIVFTKARKITELITTWVMQQEPALRNRVSSYRAGFLPEERRDIEAKLFSGEMDGVISTSALEMGIDVGGLDLCLLVGYPGTIVSTWQRGGRVGRAENASAIVLIAGNDALDQYFLRNPRNFFERKCEEAVLDPLNEEVLKRHLPCAAAETPIREEEAWAADPTIQSVLTELEENGAMFRAHQDGARHSTSRRPHRGVDLRGIGESFGIFLEDRKTLIGSAAGPRVLKECHEGAVYLHRMRQYLVTRLDLKRRNVLVKPQRLNYYTRARSEKETEILGMPLRTKEFPGFTVREAKLKVTETVKEYEKRRTSGQDLIGVVDLELPPIVFKTVGIWIYIPGRVKEAVEAEGLHFMGGIHALEHAVISLFPLYVLCDRDDIGGIATPFHEQVQGPAVFIYDGHPGGVGLSHRAYDRIVDLLKDTRLLVEDCPCEDGCPSCIHSPKCGSGNKPLDKQACLAVLKYLLEPKMMNDVPEVKKPKAPLIFPDLTVHGKPSKNNDLDPIPEGQGRRTKVTKRGNASPKSGARDSETNSRSDKEHERGKVLVEKSPLPPLFQRGERGDSLRSHFGPQVTRLNANQYETGREAQPGALLESRDDDQPRTRAGALGGQVAVFDLETQKLADEVGGWNNIAKMKLSLAVVHTEEHGFQTFTEENVGDLVDLLKSSDLVVGFNQIGFDYQVLSAYTSENLRALPNLDMLTEVQKVLGFRLKLQHLAEVTLGAGKSGDGLDAVKWFREGRMDLIEKYCRDDVRITRDVYLYGLEKGYLLYKTKRGIVTRIPVEWRAPARKG